MLSTTSIGFRPLAVEFGSRSDGTAHLAAGCLRSNVIESLLENGGTSLDRNGTPLHLAAAYLCPNVIAFLLQNDAVGNGECGKV